MVSTKTARPSTDASTKPGSSKRVRLLHRDKKIKLETTILDAGLPAALAATAIACKVPKFLRSLYAILQTEDPHIISWVQNKDLTPNCITAFHILQMERFEREILPKYFKHRKFASFQRQLNNFGFRKWTKTQSSGVCTFSHNCFPPDLSGSDGSTMSIRDQWRQKSTQVVPPLGSQSLHQRVVGNSITKVKTKQPQLNYSNSSSRRRPVNVQVPERDMTDSSPCSAGVYRSPSANAGMETSSFRHSLSHQPPLKKLARPNLAIKQDLSDSLNGLEAFCDSSYKPLILPPLQPRHVAATGTLAPCFSNHSEPDIPRVSSEFRLSLSQVLSTNSSVTAESSFNNSGPKVFSPKHCDAQPPSCPPVENQHGGNDGMADAVALQGFFLEPWLWDAQASSSSFESGSFSLDFDCKSDFDCKTEFDWQEASCVAGSAGIPNKEQCHRQDRSEASNAEEFGLDTLLFAE